MHTAIGRSLVSAIAISLCLITSSYALPATASAAKADKPLVLINSAKTKHVVKKSVRLHRNERKVAKAKANDKVAAKPAPISNRQTPDEPNQAASGSLPPEVANAHAELSPGDIRSSESSSTLTETETEKNVGIETANNGVQIAAADQFNDIDRDLAAETSSSPAPIKSAVLADSRSTMLQTLMNQGQSWNGATWIGKIFIGLGAMLTLASAARMLIA